MKKANYLDIDNFFNQKQSIKGKEKLSKENNVIYMFWFDGKQNYRYIGQSNEFQNRVCNHLLHIWNAYRGINEAVQLKDSINKWNNEVINWNSNSPKQKTKLIKQYKSQRKHLINDFLNGKKINLTKKYLKIIMFLEINNLSIDKIRWEIIEVSPSRDKLNDLEAKWIKKYDSMIWGFNAPDEIERTKNKKVDGRFTSDEDLKAWQNFIDIVSKNWKVKNDYTKVNAEYNLWWIFTTLYSKETSKWFWMRKDINLSERYVNSVVNQLNEMLGVDDKSAKALLAKNNYRDEFTYPLNTFGNMSNALKFFKSNSKNINKQIKQFKKIFNKDIKENVEYKDYTKSLDLKLMADTIYSAYFYLTETNDSKNIDHLINMPTKYIAEQCIARAYLHNLYDLYKTNK